MKIKPEALKKLVPTVRRESLMIAFYGAVKTRIADCQKAFWSRFVSAGFTAEDIQYVWPEDNMRFFQMKYSDHMQSFQLRDLNLRELEELMKWLTQQFDFDPADNYNDPPRS